MSFPGIPSKAPTGGTGTRPKETPYNSVDWVPMGRRTRGKKKRDGCPLKRREPGEPSLETVHTSEKKASSLMISLEGGRLGNPQEKKGSILAIHKHGEERWGRSTFSVDKKRYRKKSAIENICADNRKKRRVEASRFFLGSCSH